MRIHPNLWTAALNSKLKDQLSLARLGTIPKKFTRSVDELPPFKFNKFFSNVLCLMAIRTGSNINDCKGDDEEISDERDLKKFIIPRASKLHVMF